MNDRGSSTVFEELLKRLAHTFAEHGIPYMVIGGQAVLLYGEPRLTKDIDITIGVAPQDGMPVIEILSKIGFQILVDDPMSFLSQTFVIPVQDMETGIRVDVVFSLSEYEREALKRANQVVIGEEQIMFIALEDLIIHKIIAGRPRDLEDTAILLTKNPGSDLKMIFHWLDEHDKELGTDFRPRLESIINKNKPHGDAK